MKRPKTGVKARALVITPLGFRILREVAAGTYRFAPGRPRRIKGMKRASWAK